MKKIFFYAIVLLPSCIFSQVYNPLFKINYTVTNQSNQDLYNFQKLITLNTSSLVSAGHMNVNGDDIRFTADSCNPVNHYDYWIESGMNTANTRIWVKIPYMQAFSNNGIVLWYGDLSASSQSNFTNTFPVSFISSGHDTILSGVLNYDWFQLDSGDQITLQDNSVLEIKSQVIKIYGNIDGNGKGYSSPGSVGNGGGPGGGELSVTAGAGGGSYGGIGGTGGMDPGDFPGVGGMGYGALNDIINFMGSAGGSTDNATGGNGGGGLKLQAEWIEISGNISMNGLMGVGSIGRCGGGGAGGTILLVGENIDLSSTCFLSATGGNGGSGTSTANDGGGGGGGGRIKVFYGSSFNNNASFSVFGGTGGLFGSQSPGTAGGNGTYYDTTYSETPTYISSVGAETDLVANIIGLDSLYCINKDTIHLYALPPGGTFAGPGVAGNYFFPFTAGPGTHQITYLYNDPGGCTTLYDTATVTVLNIPTFPSALNNSPVCAGNTVLLEASDSLSTHYWVGPNGFTSNLRDPVIPTATINSSGNYTVTITNASGCSSTVVTNVVVNPAPNVTITNNAPVCLEEDLSFSATGGLSYTWQGPNGFSSALQNPVLHNSQLTSQGTYTITVSGAEGCQTTLTFDVQVNGCYFGIDDEEENSFTIYPNPAYDHIWIETGNNTSYLGDVIIELYDVSGKKLAQKNSGNQFISPYYYSLDGVASGTYIVQIKSDRKTENFKIIKQ